MSDGNGTAPELRHFKVEVTDDKLTRYLDTNPATFLKRGLRFLNTTR